MRLILRPFVSILPSSTCFATIQAAVDAAAAGDTIVVSPNPPKGYTENVVVNTVDLTIKGRSNPHCTKATAASTVVVDNCETTAFPTSCGGSGFEINASGVTIENFLIRHGRRGIDINGGGSNATINNVCFIEIFEGIDADPGSDVNNVTVSNCHFNGIRAVEAVDIQGDDATVTWNVLLNTDGVKIMGDRATVKFNTIKVTTDNECIEIDGDYAYIADNLVDGCESDSIDYRGDNSTIRKNHINSTADDENGIDARGDYLKIEENVILIASDSGIEYQGNSSTIYGNIVENTGADSDSEPGIQIRGDDNMIIENITRENTFAGIKNDSGDRNTYRGNISERNGKSGIQIEDGSDNVVDQNRFRGNHGEGINNASSAVATVITDNTSTKNRTDVCNDGDIATFTGNDFATGGTGTPCVVEK